MIELIQLHPFLSFCAFVCACLCVAGSFEGLGHLGQTVNHYHATKDKPDE